jgi:hypothetical protein
MQNLEKVAFGRAKVSNLFGGAVDGIYLGGTFEGPLICP